VRPSPDQVQAALPPPPSLPAPAVVAPAAPAVATSGWTPDGGTSVVLKPGETLSVLSRRYGVPESALVSANGLSSAAAVRPGQAVIIPAYRNTVAAATAPAQLPIPAPQPISQAPQIAAAPGIGAAPAVLGQVPPQKPAMPVSEQVAAAVAPKIAVGGSYVVRPGDSLARIAVAHGIRSSDLLAANGLEADKPLRIGQSLKIPAPGEQVKVASAATTATDAPTMPPLKTPQPVPTVAAAPAAPKPAAPAAPAAPAQQVAAVAPQQSAPSTTVRQPAVEDTVADGSFRWPVRGRVISGFGAKPGGERNDGINIEVPEGTAIKAAEQGEVIYAGNELAGYGNLVLVKHPNGFVSAYAHASEILVRRGDKILRGQTIAKVGSTGNVPRPQLHFEIRQGNRPVDPLPYLSG